MPDDTPALLLARTKAPADPRLNGATRDELDALARKFWDGCDTFTPGGIPVTWAKLTPAEQHRALKLRKPAAPEPPPKAEFVSRAEMQAAIDAAIVQHFELVSPVIKEALEQRDEAINKGIDAHNHNVEVLNKRRVQIEVLQAQIELLQAQLAAMKVQLEGVPHDGGIYQSGKSYRRGAMVTHHGSMFIAQVDTTDPIGTNPPSPAWRLCVQRGRDAR